MLTYHVEVVELDAQPAAVVRGYVAPASLPEFLGPAFADAARTLAEQGLKPAGPPFARYSPVDGDLAVEAGFPTSKPVRPAGRVWPIELPGGTAIRTLHHGSYAAAVAAYDALEQWAAEHHYVHTGRAWEVYLDGPDVPKPRTQVILPCRSRE
jgi:effector-binding domain-containing protein